jgi:hypothetical protein
MFRLLIFFTYTFLCAFNLQSAEKKEAGEKKV